MLDIHRIVCNALQENCYIVSDETRECVIIDCGAYYPQDIQAMHKYIEDNKLTPVRLLATHGHIDHNFGNQSVFEKYGLRPEIHLQDKELMSKTEEQLMMILGTSQPWTFPSVSSYFSDGDSLTFGNHALKVLHTPGHTPGSVFLIEENEKTAFSGDTLFYRSIGRTDFPGGSMFQMIQSLRKVSQLPDDLRIYPGHDRPTTIGDELIHNPYMDR